MEDFVKEIEKEYKEKILEEEFNDDLDLRDVFEEIGYMRLCYLLTDEQRKLTDQLPIGDYEGSRAFYKLWDTIKDPKAHEWLDDCYEHASNETDEACFDLLFEIFKQKAIADGVILKES